jgi:hypothetical protein
MSRFFTPLRPKRPVNQSTTGPLGPSDTPMSSPSYLVPEVVVKMEPAESVTEPMLQSIEEHTVQEPSETISSSEGDPHIPWPSEIYNRGSTMWLLPPHSDQSSVIASLLQTEIQSHKITREMLHTTEQQRIDAIQQCNQLMDDSGRWAAAYNNLSSALKLWTDEFSRISADNAALKAQLQDFKVVFKSLADCNI